MLTNLDTYLGNIPLYKLTLYYLIAIFLNALILSLGGLIPFKPADLILTSVVALLVGIIVNYILAGLFSARTNYQSVFITVLILILIMPIKFPTDLPFVVLAVILGIASKYLLTIDKRHIFNPAAVAAVGIALLYPDRGITWWVGNPALLPLIAIGGLLLIRKLRRENLVATFLIVYLAMLAFGGYLRGNTWSATLVSWQLNLFHSAFLFFTFVMLTEPLTAPANPKIRLYFAALIALFYSTLQLHFWGISLTPESALCLGNIFAYLARPKQKVEPASVLASS